MGISPWWSLRWERRLNGHSHLENVVGCLRPVS
ncbi:unnamed protein product [Cyprideis torosa]|uniref:Uncharacterized protein n=1 Tax=Cyprideis torosa TaxID=163714 RepID=A0A7R8WRG9_9CRUS|nr:unnamed protein product [Cyprideis torosa]CAG0908748.1 unnamed protein product [Cyprideis torosa]